MIFFRLYFHLIIFVLALSSSIGWATSSYELISEQGTSAEMISLGNIEGFSGSSSGVFENPAALFRVRQFGATFFTSEIISQSQFTLLSMAYRIPYGVVGLGYMSNEISGIPHTGEPGSDGLPILISTFSETKRIFKASYMMPVYDQLYLGTTFNYYTTSLFTVKANAFDFDFGSIYKWNRWTFSAQLKNVLSKEVNYSRSDDSSYSGKEVLPRWIVLGSQYRLRSWRFMGQVSKRPQHTLFSVGIRYTPTFLEMLSLQMGIQQQPLLNDVKSTVTFGVLLELYGVKIANSFQSSQHPEFDNYTYLSIQLDI